MQAVSGGDMAAFEELVGRHQALVAGTVARMLGDNSEVDDIAQQVFVRVWKSIPNPVFPAFSNASRRSRSFREQEQTSRSSFGFTAIRCAEGSSDRSRNRVPAPPSRRSVWTL